MKLDAGIFGAAAGVAAGAVFTLCALFVAVAPQTATAVFSYVLHLDLTGLARHLTFGSFFAGLFFWGIGTALVFSIAARIYNGLAARPVGQTSLGS